MVLAIQHRAGRSPVVSLADRRRPTCQAAVRAGPMWGAARREKPVTSSIMHFRMAMRRPQASGSCSAGSGRASGQAANNRLHDAQNGTTRHVTALQWVSCKFHSRFRLVSVLVLRVVLPARHSQVLWLPVSALVLCSQVGIAQSPRAPADTTQVSNQCWLQEPLHTHPAVKRFLTCPKRPHDCDAPRGAMYGHQHGP
jgi:hypothetical protein